jgi:hypothetical protein
MSLVMYDKCKPEKRCCATQGVVDLSGCMTVPAVRYEADKGCAHAR